VGLTTLEIEIGSPATPEITEKLELLIDSGAIYSVVPAPILHRLGIKPLALGLALDPLRRELRPLPMIL